MVVMPIQFSPAAFSPPTDDATRRQFLALLAASGLLTACGAPADAPPPAERATRTAETPRGPVTVPVEPQRVVAVYTHDLANALALGLPVIAGPGEGGQPGSAFPPYLVEAYGDRLAEVTRLPYQPETNIEQVAALRPDVILAGVFGSGVDEPIYGRLDAIAPTVTYLYSEGGEYSIVPWQTVLRQNAAAFGREAAAEEFVTRFEQRAARMREQIAARWAGATYAVVEPYQEQVYLYGPAGGHIPVTLTDELGLAVAGSVEKLLAESSLGQGGAEVSYERIGELDADIVFMPVGAGADGAPDRSGVELLTSRSVWSSVPAVANGQVHEFTGDIFYESGPMAAAFLDVVERSLLS